MGEIQVQRLSTAGGELQGAGAKGSALGSCVPQRPAQRSLNGVGWPRESCDEQVCAGALGKGTGSTRTVLKTQSNAAKSKALGLAEDQDLTASLEEVGSLGGELSAGDLSRA